ncbi:hypothetical protein E4U17_007586 [Claviceps sp. LM77 group G4]|nr:hypothetical protein E4U17_007586 [Claviceps sp. LM77 group G4]KAG6071692.1 hypothetical protein E4U16_005947 [Claviceps sp. LM84 group G4]
MQIARPVSTVEFAFGPDLPPPQIVGGNHLLVDQSSAILDATQSFEILVGGFDIWAQVMTFIFNDGRCAPGMCAPHKSALVPSSLWSVLTFGFVDLCVPQPALLYEASPFSQVYLNLDVSEYPRMKFW